MPKSYSLLHLAGPAILGAYLQNAYRPLDQIFVAGLGADAQGAIAATTFLLFPVYGVVYALSGGLTPRLARAFGADDAAEQREWIGAALVGVLLFTALSLSASALSGPMVRVLGLGAGVESGAIRYMRLFFLSSFGIALGPVVESCYYASGNTRVPFALQGATLLLYAILSPLLIASGWGVSGAALGANVGQSIVALVGLRWLWREHGLTRAELRLGARLGAILWTGWPLAVSSSVFGLVYSGLIATSIGPLGDDVVAGLGLGFGVFEPMTVPVYLGLSIALGSVVGRHLGAGQPQLAREATARATSAAALLGVVGAVIFGLSAGPLASWAAADASVAHEAALYAMILAFSQPFVAVEIVLEGALAGAGRTQAVMWSNVPLNMLRVPLAWLFAFTLGGQAAGVWWALNTTSVAKAALKGVLVYRGVHRG